jgi:HK97 family phage portal protein
VTVVISGKSAKPIGDAKSWPLAGVSAPMRVTSSKAMDLIGLDISASYAAIYNSQPWVYATVNKLARNMSRLPLRSYREDGNNGSRSELRRGGDEPHGLPNLLSRPYPQGSSRKLVEYTFGQVATYGHALWWKYRARPGQPPIELWPLDWRYITMQTGSSVPIDFFEYRGPMGVKRFLPDDVVHFEWWSPVGPRGTSPLEPLRITLGLEDAGRRYSVASFANGIRPSGALVSEKPVQGDARKELKAEIEAIHQNPDNAFRMMLLDAGLDWKPFGQSAVDAELINLRKLNREEVAAVYDIPPPMIQILDRATFSNIDEQHQMLYVDTFGPWLSMFEDTVRAQLLWGEPMLGFAADPEDSEIEETLVAFDLSELLRPDIAKRAAAYLALRYSGAWTVDDTREAEGKPKFDSEVARSFLTPLNFEIHAGSEEDAAAIDALDRAPAGAPGATGSEVASMLSLLRDHGRS